MKRVLFLAAILVAMAVVGCGGATPSPTATPLPPSPTPEPTPTPITVAGIIEALTPSTVLIYSEFPDGGATGTGIIYDESGLTLTNAHVVEGAAIIKAYVQGVDRWLSAQVVGLSTCEDLAVIDISGEGYVPATLGESDEMTLGEDVIALGYPLASTLGADLTVNRGVVSKLHAQWSEFGELEDLIQTDTDINPGNSGGPLVNMQGEVIGINTLKMDYTRSGRPVSGINFAIASSHAKPIIERLAAGENPHWIGANVFTNDPDVASYFGLAVEEGLYVYAVSDGSPAAEAGMETGDVVMTMKGINVSTMVDVCDILRSNPEGKPIPVQVMRGTKVLEGDIWGEKLSVTSEAGPTISPFTFTEAVDENDNCINPSTAFPAGTTRVYTCWDYAGMQDGTAVRMVWLRDGQNFDEGSDTWQGGEEGSWWWWFGDEAGMDPGNYEAQFYVEGQLAQSGTFTVTGAEVGPTPEALRLTDTFDDNRNGWYEGEEEGVYSVYVQDGAYHIVSIYQGEGVDSFVLGATTVAVFSNLDLDVDATQVEGTDNNEIAVVFGVQDLNNLYEFRISGDGYVSLGRYVNGGWEAIEQWAETGAIKQGNATNHIRLIVENGNLTAYVNDKLVLTSSVGEYESGYIGFGCGPFEEPAVHCAFDNLDLLASP
ncbi:MAG: trypsin-like peptidase domain-containing protein [Anaerolineae bacterium]|nr:trypsin-like peptidase domain-containing protein [Anaerolineae bacterium]